MKTVRILIVEDNVVIAESLRNTLNWLGYTALDVAVSGEEAIRKAAELQPDMVLMDIMLEGEMDGIEAAGQIHTRLGIPIIYTTAHSDERTLQRARVTEPYSYILKPYNARELNSNIKIALYKHEMEQKLRASEERFRAVVETANDAIITADSRGNIVSCNSSAQVMFGYSVDEVNGQPLTLIMPERYRKGHQNGLKRVVSGGESNIAEKTVEWVGIRKGGSEFPLELSLTTWQAGGKVFFTAIVRDITKRVQAEKKLRYLAITDSLTGIFNRRHFFELAERELERARRYNRLLSIILLDIDHFKWVNDTYGHATGDQALQALTTQCQESLRESDIFARYGGEEFVILLPETDLEQAQQVAERIRKEVADLSIHTAGNTVSITISLGVASLVDREMTLDKLLARADKALYASKEGGRNRVTIFRN
ncbi:MAG: diguanylate cyclase [Anaerolineales bacterium]